MLRALSGIEHGWVQPPGGEFVQMAIKFRDAKDIPKAIENYKKVFIGTRLCVQDNHFYKVLKPFKVDKLPNWIQECKSAAEWIFEQNTPDISNIMTTIACNDDIIAVNAHHTVAGGGFLLKAAEHSLDANILNGHEPYSCPTPNDIAHGKFVDEACKKIDKVLNFQDSIPIRIDQTDPHLDLQKKCSELIIPKNIDIKELQCYNKQKKRPEKINENLWTSYLLSIAAYDHSKPNETCTFTDSQIIKFITPFVTTLITDLSKLSHFDKSKIDWSYCSQVAMASFGVKPSLSMSLKQVGALLRKEFDRTDRDGEILAVVKKGIFNPNPNYLYGATSSMGVFQLKPYMKDAYFNSTNSLHTPDHYLFMLTYTVVKPNRTEFRTSVRYAPSTITTKVAKTILESTHYAMSKIPLDTTLRDSFNEIVRFQRGFKADF